MLHNILSQKKYQLLVCMVIILYWVFQSVVNTLHDDDLIMLNEFHQYGIISTMLHFYDGWNTRWITFLWQGCWYLQWNKSSSPFLYNLFTFLTLIAVVFSFLKAILQTLCNFYLSKKENLICTILFIGGLTACTYDIHETWFWVSGSTMYGWNLIAAFFSIAMVLQHGKWYTFPSLLICALYIGGASEPFAVCYILLCLYLILLYKSDFKIDKLKLGWLLFGTVLSLLIAYLGKGHLVRSAALPSFTPTEIILRSVYFFFKMDLWSTPLRLVVAFVLMLPTRSILNQKNYLPLFSLKTAFDKNIKKLIAVGILWTYIHCLILCVLMGSAGPSRAWSSISWLNCLIVFYIILNSKSATEKITDKEQNNLSTPSHF